MTDDLMPLSELEYRAGREGRQGGVELVTAIDGKAIYAQDGFDRAVRIDPRILAVCHSALVFVDAGSWTVRHITALPKIDVSEVIRGKLSRYPGGFTSVDEYDNNFDAFVQAWQDAINADPEDTVLPTMTVSLASSFGAFAGMSLAIQVSDVQGIIAQLRKVRGNIKPMSEAQATREWKDWIGTFQPDEKPNKATRFEWGRLRGLTRDRTSQLHKELSPDHWKLPGANRTPR